MGERFDPSKKISFPAKANQPLIESFNSPFTLGGGKYIKSLIESARINDLKGGDVVISGVQGIDQSYNSDRVVGYPTLSFVAVISGQGQRKHKSGEEAAEILADHFLNSPEDINLAVSEAKKEMAQPENNLGIAGAVFASARIIREKRFEERESKYLYPYNMGVARVLVIKKNGTIKFATKDQSLVQAYVNNGQITHDQALYHEDRDIDSTAVSPVIDEKLKPCEIVKLELGDLIILMTPGVAKNITPAEIEAKQEEDHLPINRLFFWISKEVDKRMKNAEEIIKQTPDRSKSGVYSDRYKSKPISASCALAIIEIK